jgi:hypothetical protein
MVDFADKMISHGHVHDVLDVPGDFEVADLIQSQVDRFMGRVPFPDEV